MVLADPATAATAPLHCPRQAAAEEGALSGSPAFRGSAAAPIPRGCWQQVPLCCSRVSGVVFGRRSDRLRPSKANSLCKREVLPALLPRSSEIR